MTTVIHMDAETHGYNKEVSSVKELQETIAAELDENVLEVSIKKRAVKDNVKVTCGNSENECVRKINVLGVTYTIKEVEVVNKAEARKGEIDYLTNEIKIDKSMPPSLKNQVLMHEILHAALDLLGHSELAEDEEKVQSIATALHQIFTTQTIFSF